MTYKIAVLPCDGVGPEVVAEGLKVLQAACDKYDVKYDTVEYDIGGQRYLRTGETLPDSLMEELRQMDAIYLGAVGHPDVPPGVLEKGILLALRFGLDQYINLRPVKLYPGVDTPLKDKGPEDIDFVVVRENTEDMYVGVGGNVRKGTAHEIATQTAIYTRRGTERCIRYAFELAGQRNKDNKVTLVDKANVLTYGHDLWQRTFAEVGEEYTEIEKDRAYVDACCMWMVKNPEGVSMFEPIHGSAPKYTGKNVVCPIAAISAVGMMMEHLGEKEMGQAIENAVIEALASGKLGDLSTSSGVKTTEAGDLVASLI